MIQERHYSNEPMLQKDDFESVYTKKLEALVIQLKDILKGDIPYSTGLEFACHICSCRIKVYAQEEIYCLGCSMPYWWTKDLKACVTHILESYPPYHEHKQQWMDSHANDRLQLTRQEIGHKIRKARTLLSMSQQGLANMIFKKEGSQQRISQKTITDYELGKSQPCQYIIEQLEQVLSIELRRKEEVKHAN